MHGGEVRQRHLSARPLERRERLRRAFLRAVASSPRVKLATALVLRLASLRSAYSRTLAMMYSEKLTRSPASPLSANSLWLSTSTSLSSSVFTVVGGRGREQAIEEACSSHAHASHVNPASGQGREGSSRRKRARESVGSSLVMICCTAVLSLHTTTKSLPRMPGDGGRRGRVSDRLEAPSPSGAERPADGVLAPTHP